jgi:hypothetical protein
MGLCGDLGRRLIVTQKATGYNGSAEMQSSEEMYERMGLPDLSDVELSKHFGRYPAIDLPQLGLRKRLAKGTRLHRCPTVAIAASWSDRHSDAQVWCSCDMPAVPRRISPCGTDTLDTQCVPCLVFQLASSVF